jgi:hypothetical protein
MPIAADRETRKPTPDTPPIRRLRGVAGRDGGEAIDASLSARRAEVQSGDAPETSRERAAGGSRALLTAAALLLWIGVPAAVLLFVGSVGTGLDAEVAIYMTVALWALMLIAIPLSGIAAGRWLSGPSGRPPGSRRPQLRDMRPPPLYEVQAGTAVDLPFAVRLVALGLVTVMLALAIAMWTAVPAGWLWVSSQLAETTSPELGPFALAMAGSALTVVVLAKGLAALDRLYTRLTLRPEGKQRRAEWLRSLGDARERRPRGIL